MEPYGKRTQRDYSLAFKLSVVDQVEKGEMNYKDAQKRYGIQGRSTVLTWLRKHGCLDWSRLTPSGKGRWIGMPDKPASLTPEQRIKELEVALREANEKAQLFEAIVEIIRNEHGGKAVKKPSGKSLGKTGSKA